MTTTYDVEVSISGGLFVQGFNGPNAWANARAWTDANPLPSGEYAYYVTALDMHWVGPRAGRP